MTSPHPVTNGDIDSVYWDAGNEYFVRTDPALAPLISYDGQTWVLQSTEQAFGGTYPNNNLAQGRFRLGSTVWHLKFQWEEYYYRTGDSGTAAGWTYNGGNNGVIAGAGGLQPITNLCTDGSLVAVTSAAMINMSSLPSSWPDSWGPDGNDNAGYHGLAWGWPAGTGNITAMLYIAEQARPWIFFNDVHGWYDAASLTTGVAPSVTKCTAAPFAALNTAWDTYGHEPKANIELSALTMIYHEQNTESPFGLYGWAIVMDGNAQDDYIVMRRP
jgi:hypothetical protein